MLSYGSIARFPGNDTYRNEKKLQRFTKGPVTSAAFPVAFTEMGGGCEMAVDFITKKC